MVLRIMTLNWATKLSWINNRNTTSHTLLVELQCALAPLGQPHNSHHLGPQAGAALLVSSYAGGVGSWAAGAFLQAVHGATDAGAAHHVPGGRHTHPPGAGHLHWAAEHHGPTQASGEGGRLRGQITHQDLQYKHSLLSFFFFFLGAPAKKLGAPKFRPHCI